jgi:hypothetical protein
MTLDAEEDWFRLSWLGVELHAASVCLDALELAHGTSSNFVKLIDSNTLSFTDLNNLDAWRPIPGLEVSFSLQSESTVLMYAPLNCCISDDLHCQY